jgi:hypothetical protein
MEGVGIRKHRERFTSQKTTRGMIAWLDQLSLGVSRKRMFVLAMVP